MFLSASTKGLSTTAIFSAILLMAGCGGGGGGQPAHEHEPGAEQEELHEDLVAPPAPPGAQPPQTAEFQIIQGRSSPDVPTAAAPEVIALASITTPLIQGTYYNTAYWPVWYGNGKPVDGVNCLASGAWHKHALISIYKDGKRLGFPGGIGREHAGCYHAYEMHTHDVTGIVHMESDLPKNFKLGQWFSLWQLPLSRDNVGGLPGPVRFYIIDKGVITRYDGNPYDIAMLPNREVLIVTGFALSVVPKYQWPLGI